MKFTYKPISPFFRYQVDPGTEADGSSVVNEWKLAMGAELGL